MAEVGDWSPVDDDNNSAPPVGAPEGMMPAAVNNTMRAMMGSLRRWYDKVVDGTLALPYLPLAGGTVTGNVAIDGIGGLSLRGVQLKNELNGLTVSHPTGGYIYSGGPDCGVFYGDTDGVGPDWGWDATGGFTYLWNFNTNNVLVVNQAGDMAVAHSVDTLAYNLQGYAFAAHSGAAHVIYDGGGSNVAISLYPNDTYSQANTHHWTNDANTQTMLLDASGSLTAQGNITAVGTITGQQLTSTGNINAAGTVTGLAVNSNGNMGVAGNLNCAGTVSAHALVDIDGAMSVFDVLADLQARVAALEGMP